MLRAIPRTFAATMLVCLVLGTTPNATASPAPAPAPAPASTHDDRHGDPLLERVSRVLAPDALGADDVVRPRRQTNVTLALRDLFLARPSLDGPDREHAGRLLARPTQGAKDPRGDGYRAPATRLCGRHVCVHWVRKTSDAPPDRAWVQTTLRVMEHTWRHHVKTMGYRHPPSDRGRGGNARFDVYLKELGDVGLYGYCTPEKRTPGRGRRASSYCVLDNDFARAQFGRLPLDSLRVTAAHEFFHAVQFGYDFREDPWLLESTATWMEEQTAGNVNDNRVYLPYGQLIRPGRSLDLFDTTGYGQYGNWLWWQYLSQRFGPSVVRSVIRQAGTGGGLPNLNSTAALRAVLNKRGGLAHMYRAYASANVIPATTYPEGRHFPQPVPALDRRLGRRAAPVKIRTRINHLAARHLRVKPRRSAGRRTHLRVSVNGPPRATRPGAVLTIGRADGSYLRRDVPLNRHGNAAVSVPFDHHRFASVTLTLVNASPRFDCGQGTDFTCRGTPLDQRRKFSVVQRVVRR